MNAHTFTLRFMLLLSIFFGSNIINAQCPAGQTFFSHCYNFGETDNIVFEMCPSAGTAAQATINQGTFDNFFNDNLTVYEGTTGSGTSGTIVFGPMTGDVSGNVVSGTTADECLIFVVNSIGFPSGSTCQDGFQTQLEVCGESITVVAVSFTAPSDLCINAGVQSGLGGGTPAGGVYSGPGVTDDGNGLTYSFNPATAGVGVHTLTYTNVGSVMDDVEVFANSASFTALMDLCIDAGIQTGLGGGAPAGGTYSGSGVTDDGNGSTYTFNPGIAGLGVHTITYTGPTPCSALAMDDVEILVACGCPAGQISFFHCYDNNETNLVIFEVCPTAGMSAQADIIAGTMDAFDDDLSVYSGMSGSGTGGSLVFGPSSGNLAGMTVMSGIADDCLIFVINSGAFGSCQDGLEIGLEVCGSDIASFVDLVIDQDWCINAGVQTGLSGGTPTGGVYSGPGVTDDGNGMTYSFDPAAAGIGTHTITYTQGGNTAMDDVEVFATGTVTFVAPSDICIDAGIQSGLVGGAPFGGIYSGPGVTDNANGTFDFDPLIAGLGVHTLTYTGPGCMESATDDIEVLAACGCPMGETSYFNCYNNNESNLVIFEVCPTVGMAAIATVSQGSYDVFDDNLTIYQGASGSGTGGTIVFGPQGGDLTGSVIMANVLDECLIFVSNSGPFSSCADGFEQSLLVCGTSGSLVMFTALPDLSVNAGVQTGLTGGSPTGGVYSGPGVTDDGNGMTYAFNPAVAGVGIHTLTYTQGGESATDDVEVLNLLPPSFSKTFSPNNIGSGNVTTLTFTIDNSASPTPATDLSFVDNLPAGMTVATPANINHTCFTGTVNAPEGGSVISFTDGVVPAFNFCTISINVTTSTVGASTNTTGDLTSSSGNSGTASANLTVDARCPLFSKSFSPSIVNLGERSTLTFTIDNTAGAVDLNSARFIDNLPVGLVVASPSNASTTCSNGIITAIPGSNIISYDPTVFGQTSVAAGSLCTITVDVTPESAETFNNVTENFTVLNNFFQTLNCGYASAVLEVRTPSELLIQKSFGTNPVQPGGATNLEITITNLDRDFTATDVAFTDDLTAVLAGLTATGTPLNDVCGVGSQLSGTTMLSFTGGTIPPNGSCTITVPLQVPAGATPGAYTNITSTVTANLNGLSVTGNMATEDLIVANVPTFTKTFLDNPIPSGGTSTLEFTITNTSTTSALTDIIFTDNLSDFLSGATVSALPAANSCGAGSIFFTFSDNGKLVFQLTGGTIAAGSSCTFSTDVQIPNGTAPGTYTNTTSFLSGTVDGSNIQASPASDDLVVLAVPKLSKSFTDDPVNAGDIVNLEFSLTYAAEAVGDASGISFTDDLNAVIPGLAAAGLPLNNICGVGSQINGTTNLSFTGGNMSPGQTCTFSVPVQVPAGIVPGTYTNTTSALSATVGGQMATSSPATDGLLIGGLTFTKEFTDDPVIPGDLVNLRFTIENTTTFDATNVVFTDNLNTVIPGLVAEAPLPVMPCGATLTGTNFLIFVGGTVSAGTSCSFDVPVRVPAGASSGTYTNVTSNLTTILDGATRVLPSAIDQLEVDNNLIQLTKTFTDDPVTPGGTVTVEYTLTNLDPVNAVSNIAFTEDFDGLLSGLQATGLPMSNICGAGSQISGTGLVSFTGGSLAAGASCTFSITLQTPVATPFGTVLTCTTSSLTGTSNGLPVVGDPAFDDLQFQLLQLTKSFAGPVAPGATTMLTFTITNFDPVNPIDQIAFTDDLDAVISGLVATALPMTSTCGSSSEITGTSVLSFGRGRLEAGQSCSFDVTVQVPCGITEGAYTNTTSMISGDGINGGIMGPPATADLMVETTSSAAFTAPADLCLDAGNQTGLSGGTPVGGTYSGAGVTDGGDGMTYSFDPTTAGTGTHTLTYTYTDGNSCTTSATDDIEIFALPIVAFTAPTDLCLNAGIQTGLGGGTPPQGTMTGDMGVYSGTGVTDDGNGMTYSFDPATAGVGTHTLTYSYTDENGCSNSASDDIDVFAAPNTSFTAPADLCLNSGIQTGLTGGLPMGGIYSGSGVTDDGNGMTYSFDPATAGIGTHTITYDVMTMNGCSDSASDDVEVFALPNASFTSPADMCVDAVTNVYSLLGMPSGAGGVFSGPGVTNIGDGVNFLFNPAVAGVGTHTLTYTYTNGNGCSDSASDDIEIFALPTVAFTALADLCLNSGVQTGLGGGTPPQGTTQGDMGAYSGTGVTDDGNGMTYSFDPAAAGVGVHTLMYIYTDANGCTNSAMDDVKVFALPTVTLTALADLCVDAGIQTSLGGGIPTGGVYSGMGVTDDGNGMTYSFDPATAGVGVHTITYTVGVSGCSDSAMDDVAVLALPVVAFTALADLCVDAGVKAGLGGGTPPQGTVTGDMGIYSGTGVTDDGNGMTYSFNPAVAGVGTHTLTYTYTDENGCSASASDDVAVLALPVVAFTALADLCVDAGVQAGLGGGTPPQGTITGDMGVYSGSGVTDDGNGMTYSFDPAAAGVGTHTLTYSYTDENGCTNSASDDVEVFALPTVIFTALSDLCVDAGIQTGLGGGMPTGGVYSGTGVTDDGNGMTYSFDPATANVGTHTIAYTVGVSGCSDSASDDVEVFALPNVSFISPADMCVDATTDVHSLLGMPSGAGGVFSGPGVTNLGNGVSFLFNPAAAGVGTHTLTYTVTDFNGCSDSASDDIEIFALPTVAFTALADLCIDAGVQAGLGGGTPPEGTAQGDMGAYSGSGVTDDGNGMTYSFDPAVAGVGTHTLAYSYTDENGCMNSASDDVEVFALPTVTFVALVDLCVDAGIQTGLGGGIPTGGVYSGMGVTDDGNGMTYSFDPATAGVGAHTITYTVGVSGCSDSAMDDVAVLALPVVAFTALADLCVDAGVQAGLGGGTPPQGTVTGDIGVYSGTGVTDDGNGMTYSFNPAVAGVGTHTLTYTYTDENGCSASASDDVAVLALPVVAFTALADLCVDAGVQAGLGGGTPPQGTITGDMGVYSGSGVTDDGNGMTYSFDPAAAGVGVHTLTYTYTDENGCVNSAMDDVEVFALPTVMFTAPADICLNAGIQTGLGGGTPTGGVYSGTGVSDDGNGMTYSFDPATAGLGMHTINYDFTDTNGCVGSTSGVVNVISLSNVTFTAPTDLCLNDGVQTGLGGGSPTGGVYSGPGVSDDANGMTYSFDPAAAGVGVHTLAYNVTDMNGCSGAASDNVEVYDLPTVTFTAPADMCLDAPAGVQSLLGMPSGAGGVFSGSGVTDIGDGVNFIFTPAVAGVGTHTLTYTYTDGNGCSASATDDIEIFDLPTVTFTALPDLCVDAGVQTGLGGGMPTGGVYSGTGVTDNGNGMTYSFDPATAGVGVHTITYDFTDANGCAGSTSDDVEVFDLPVVNLSTALYYCLDAPISGVPITGGSPSGGVYSGPGVTDLGDGISYNLDPTVGGPGTITIAYTITNADGCSASAMSDIDIIDCGVEITDPCNCLDNATVIDLDAGTGGDDGQFSEIISIADATGGILPPGQSWTVVGAMGAFDAYNVPAVGVQSAGVPVATDGSVTLSYNGQTGVYELPFVHIDALGYSIMIEGPFPMGSPANVTLTIANNCTYPDPLFDPILTDEYCPSDPVVALGGTDQNGAGADGVTFTIDGMPETMLDPSALSVGSHTVVMTFDGADDGNGGVSPDGGTTPASPGCIQTVQKVISVTAGQNPIIVCPADTTIDCGSDTSPSTLGMATATDDCGNGVTVTSSDMVVMGVCPAVDTIYRTWSASDGANGMITCLQTIIVQDTIAPIFNVRTLPQDTIIDCEALPAAVLTATDECDPNMVITATLDEQVVPGECPVIDTIYRTWTTVDGCGNAVVHMQTIVVQDTTLPTFDAQPMSLMDIACDDPLPMQETLTATDNCGNVTVTPSVEMTGDVCLGRTVTYKWIADDGCNVDSVETTFNILPDADPPVFDQAIPNDTTIDCTEMIPAAAMITATDGCSGIGMPVTLMEATLSGVCAAQDTIRRIWSTADGCANAVQDTQFIFMIDDAQPTFTSPADVTIDCEVNPTDLSATGDVTDVMDACGMSNVTFVDDIDLSGCGGYTGTITRMWTVSDDCGNDTMFNQIITVQDTTPPTFTVPADITLAGHQDPYDLMTTGDVTDAADNCGQVMVDNTNVEDLDASGTGTITRTWTATDDCDNETVQVQVITIITCALTCPGDVILNLEAGECYEVASIIQPTITGDCADVIIPDTTMGFVDAFDPGNASLILNDVCGGVDLSGIPGTLSLTSSDICGTDPVGCSGQAQQNDCAFVATLISFTAPTNGLFSFDWDYLNSDNVSDDNDNFGYAVGDVNTLTFGQVTQLNEGIIFVDDPAAQNGSEVDIPVSAGQDIVFIIYDFSGCCGTATADITNFIFVEIPVQVYEIVQSCGPMDGDLLEPGTYEVCFDLLFGGMVDTTCSYNITVNEYAGPVETDLICNGALNLSINADCMVTIRADDLLEGGPYMCYDDYEITLAEHPALGDVNGVSINLPPGTSVTATVTDPNTGNSCWVTLNIEYKFPPQLQCPCEDPIFDLDGVLETTDASVDFSALACTNPVTTFDGLTTYDVAVFSITNAGDFTFEMAGLGDGLAYLFEGVFDGTCSATLVEGDDDDGVGLNPRIEASLAPGTYSLVSTHTTFNTTLGAYTWTVTAEIAGCDNTCEDFDAFIADPSLGGAPAFVGGCTTVEDYTFTDVVDEQLCETSTVTRTFIVTDNLGNTASCVAVYEFISTGSFDFPADLDGIDNEALQCDEYCGNVSGGWAYHYDDEYPGLKIPSPDADGNCPGSGRPGGSGCDFIQSAYWDHIIPVCDLQYGQDQAAYWGTYKIVRHWIISNWCTGEVEEMNQLIKIEDNDPPVVTCPDDVTVGVTGHDCDRDLMRLPYPEVEDGCGHAYATPYVHTAEGEEVVPGPYFDSRDRLYAEGEDWFVKDLPLGHNLAKWIATDGCNNYDTCEYYIIVEDLTLPVAVCESFRQVSLTEDGYAKIFAEAFDDGSNDNCGPVYFKVLREVIGGCDRINGDDSPAPGYQEWYDDYAKFCCEDVGEPVIVRLRVYDVDPGEGPVSPGAYAGHWNECWSEVTVEDKLPPAISCPPDMTVSCDNDLLLSDLENNDVDNPYGYAIGFDNCDVEITVRAAEPVDCGSDNRFFTRTFTARDPDGRTARCTQRIYLIEDPFTICDTESRCEPLQSLNVVCRSGGHTNRDNAEWPCDLVLEECGLGLDPWQLAANPANARDANGNRIALNAYPRYDNAGPLNGQILGIYPYACAQIAIDSSDQVFTLVEDACLKILRTWTVIDWCQFDAITRDPDDPDRFVGYWEYIQIIKVRNTVGPTFNDPGQTDFCDESTPDCLVSVTLTSGAEDDCTPTDHLHYAWSVDYFSDGSYDLTGNGPTFSRRVEQSHPYGLNGPGTPHTIRWTVEDGCDNTTVNEYTFTAVECKKPTPYCDNGIAIVVMPSSGSIAVWANDLDAGSFDNCTEQENLIFTIRKIVDGEPVGIPTPSLILDCSCMPNGVSETINVEIWVEDEAGNRDNCDTYILLQDTPDADMPEGVCPDDNPVPLVSGTIATEEGVSAPLHEVRLLDGDDQIIDVDFTNAGGEYGFGSLGGAYVQPVNNTNTALGLSTLDLIAIQQHILGIDALDSPYKMVAADATNDHTINVLDLLEVQKVILGLQPEFTNNQSWRYVSADEQMDMINPYTFEEPVAIPSYTDQDNIVEDFIAVKIGDVNGTAIGVAGAIERSGLVFEVNEAKVTYQDDVQEIRVPVTSSNFTSIDGYQFTVDFDQTNLTFVNIESGALTINPENVGVHTNGEVATNWYNEKAETVAAEEVLFTLVFRGESIESLTFNGAITAAESYRDGQIQSVNLVFTGNTAETFALYQNEPNPFKETTTVMFDLPSAAATTLTVFDVNGKTLMIQDIDGQAGYNEYLIKKAQLNNAAGVMYYRVDTDDYTATKKMISIK